MNTAREWADHTPEWQYKSMDHFIQKIEQIQLDARRQGYAEAAEISEKHRQELFEDGLSADLEENSPSEAFILGMEQERESITRKIMAARDAIK
jgi:glutathionyl-hydroquinone reductase